MISTPWVSMSTALTAQNGPSASSTLGQPSPPRVLPRDAFRRTASLRYGTSVRFKARMAMLDCSASTESAYAMAQGRHGHERAGAELTKCSNRFDFEPHRGTVVTLDS